MANALFSYPLTPAQILELSYINAASSGFATSSGPNPTAFQQQAIYNDLMFCLQTDNVDRYNYLIEKASDAWSSGNRPLNYQNL